LDSADEGVVCKETRRVSNKCVDAGGAPLLSWRRKRLVKREKEKRKKKRGRGGVCT